MRCLTTPGASRRGDLNCSTGPTTLRGLKTATPSGTMFEILGRVSTASRWLRAALKGKPASTWNYRVVQSSDGTEYFIAELYYDGDALSWVDGTGDCLRWGRFDDLKGTVELIRQAFDKPVLRVTGDGRLMRSRPPETSRHPSRRTTGAARPPGQS